MSKYNVFCLRERQRIKARNELSNIINLSGTFDILTMTLVELIQTLDRSIRDEQRGAIQSKASNSPRH